MLPPYGLYTQQCKRISVGKCSIDSRSTCTRYDLRPDTSRPETWRHLTLYEPFLSLLSSPLKKTRVRGFPLSLFMNFCVSSSVGTELLKCHWFSSAPYVFSTVNFYLITENNAKVVDIQGIPLTDGLPQSFQSFQAINKNVIYESYTIARRL